MSVFRKYELSFFTATIYKWKHLLKPNKYKDVIIESLKFLSKEERIRVYAFVIMDNHIHLIWETLHPNILKNIQRDFLKYIAQQIKFDLEKFHPSILTHFYTNAKDRQYQFWQRNPLSVPLFSKKVVIQKLNYIHQNPIRKDLASYPADYFYSSASFYDTGIDSFGFLKSVYE